VQRSEALDWAQDARRARQRLHDDLAAGRTDLAEVLERSERDELVAAVKLLFVLESVPGARKVLTRRRLDDLGLDGRRRLGGLDADERRVVLAEFATPRGAGS